MKPITNHQDDVTTYWVLRDSTTHAPKTSVDVTTIDLYYIEELAAISAKADVTAHSAATDAHADNYGYELGQGVYRIDWPDAAFDAGVGKSVILVVVASGVDTAYREIILSPSANVVAAGGTTVTAGDFVADVAATHVHAAAADTTVNHADYGNAKLVRSTTPANTLDVSATGEAGLDFDNIKDATGAHTLTNITVPTVTTTGTATAVTTVNGLANGVITAAAIADAAIDNATFAADVGSTAYATNIIALAVRKCMDDYDPPTDTEMDSAFATLATDDDVATATWANATGAAVYAGVVTNATGTDVGSDTAEILTRLPDAVPGAAGGVFIAGANAATSVATALTANITGDITGNLSGSVGSVTGAVGSVSAEVSANVTKINSVATTSVSAINANIGTTQPLNFTGTAGSALVKGDTVDIAGAAVSTTSAQIGANVVQVSGDATAADNLEDVFEETSGVVANLVKAFDGSTGYGFTGCTMPTTTAVTNDVGITQAGADKVWGTTSRTITALDEDSVTLDLDATIAGAVWNAAITSYGSSGTYGEAAEAVTTELAKVPKSDSNVSWNSTALAAINAEVDTALNTAIPGSPTADSINERVKALDVLTEASGDGDLAAILVDTSTTLDDKIDAILVDTGTTLDDAISNIDSDLAALVTTVGTAGAGLTALAPASTALSSSTWTNTKAGYIDMALSDIPTATENADGLLARDIGSGSNAVVLDERTVRSALRAMRNKVNLATDTMTVYTENDSTTAWTAAITTDGNADPITVVNPT